MEATIPQPKTLVEAVRLFSDPDVTLRYFVQRRWPNGVVCPTCGRTDVNFLANQKRWECKGKHPQRQFSVKVGTIMEDSALTLDKWAIGMWLITNAKNGISSYELHRTLGIGQKAAWFMLHRIRLAMQAGTFEMKLGGDGKIVEADETYIGGKARNMHKAKRAKRIGEGTGATGKAIVAGLLERKTSAGHSKVRMAVIPAASRATLHPLVRQHVEKNTQLFTDAHAGYTALGADFAHAFVDHAEKYVEGNVHTNGLENFWSLLKRSINGTYVAVEPFHLFRYLDEQAFRYNNREDKDGQRFNAVMGGISGKRLTYKALIGNGNECSFLGDGSGAANAG
jgi:transposase-like protein